MSAWSVVVMSLYLEVESVTGIVVRGSVPHSVPKIVIQARPVVSPPFSTDTALILAAVLPSAGQLCFYTFGLKQNS